MKNAREELDKAQKCSKQREDLEAIEIFGKVYKENPELLDETDKLLYAWSLYRSKTQNFETEEELIDSVDIITQITEQKDFSNKSGACPYTLSVMRILEYFKDKNDYPNIIKWVYKLNPEYLNTEVKESKIDGKIVKFPSNKEKYYYYLSKSYFELKDFEKCITVTKEALENLDDYIPDNDIWFKWRIAKSLREIGEYDEALTYLDDITKTKNEWYIFLELAENYYAKEDYDKALKYCIDSALKYGDIDKKINLYSLLESLLKDEYPEEALKHEYLIYSLKLNKNWPISPEFKEKIEYAGFDVDFRDYWEIEAELNNFWTELKFKDSERYYGKISNIISQGKAGFILADSGESYFFAAFEFKGDKELFKKGSKVSFYTEEGFDKSKGEKTINAVNVIPIGDD